MKICATFAKKVLLASYILLAVEALLHKLPIDLLKANQAKNSMDGLFLTIDSPP